MNSKMPCLPGFFPVMKEVHAGGVTGGRIEASRPETPPLMRCAIFGSLSAATHGLIRSRVAASRPIMRSLIVFIHQHSLCDQLGDSLSFSGDFYRAQPQKARIR